MTERVGYARVSTREQNLHAQLDQLRAAGCAKLFCDQGSGKDTRGRTELGRLLDYVRAGDIVVVTQLDRLSRSLMDLLSLAEQLGNKGVQLRSLSEPFDTTTENGALMFQIMGVLAEFERARIRNRTLEGLKAARAQGRVGGRPRRLNEKQEAMVWRLRQEGESMRGIARMFNVSVGTISRSIARSQSKTKSKLESGRNAAASSELSAAASHLRQLD